MASLTPINNAQNQSVESNKDKNNFSKVYEETEKKVSDLKLDKKNEISEDQKNLEKIAKESMEEFFFKMALQAMKKNREKLKESLKDD